MLYVMASNGRPKGTDSAFMSDKLQWVHACLVRDRVLLTDPDCRNYVAEYLEEGGYPALSVSGLTQFMRKVRTWLPTASQLRTQAMAGLAVAESLAREQESPNDISRVEQVRLQYMGILPQDDIDWRQKDRASVTFEEHWPETDDG